ncbi:MAG: HEAT repeat domain-containing protein [Actinomycetales bacterium]|nr:HEAT repeat domain-containing protein [Actinomycetales bacterium]
MDDEGRFPQDDRPSAVRALSDPDASVRLRAALQAGLTPSPEQVDALIDRCAVEPDFYVRDMLTWALIQHDHHQVVARLLPELQSPVPQARAQALHTFSKIGDASVWPSITPSLLADEDDDVARTAWRAAAALVPTGSRGWLAELLASQWGRGDRDVRLSLSQAIASLGDAALPVVEQATTSEDDEVRWHAMATQRIIDDPDLAFDRALEDAKRMHTLRGAPLIPERANGAEGA